MLTLIYNNLQNDIAESTQRTARIRHSFKNTFKVAIEGCGCFESVYPSAISAAIILDFALREAVTTKAPPRLPLADRAANTTSGQEGPTMEDYYIMASYQTPLFGDDCPILGTMSSPRPSRKGRHDPQFFNPKLPGSNAYHSLPEFITGLWEGVYMVGNFGGQTFARMLKCK